MLSDFWGTCILLLYLRIAIGQGLLFHTKLLSLGDLVIPLLNRYSECLIEKVLSAIVFFNISSRGVSIADGWRGGMEGYYPAPPLQYSKILVFFNINSWCLSVSIYIKKHVCLFVCSLWIQSLLELTSPNFPWHSLRSRGKSKGGRRAREVGGKFPPPPSFEKLPKIF